MNGKATDIMRFVADRCLSAGGEAQVSYRWIGVASGVVLGVAVWFFHISAVPELEILFFSGLLMVQIGIGYWLGRKYEILQNMAHTDSLTGVLVNRRFSELLQKEVERAKRHGYNVALMFIDLDNFKKYNDRYGHIAGDRLLAQFAQFLNENVREQDSVGRWGGEEFVILLPHTDTEQGLIAGKRLQSRLREDLSDITVSIGLATFPYHADSATELAARADELMYEAKKKKDCLLAGPLSS